MPEDSAVPEITKREGPPHNPPPPGERSPHPDKEPLIRDARETIAAFFGRASQGVRTINESSTQVRSALPQLEEVNNTCSTAQSQLSNEREDYHIQNARDALHSLRGSSGDIAETLRTRFSDTQLTEFIQKQADSWLQTDRLDTFIEELRDAANEPDEKIRGQKLTKLLGFIKEPTEKIRDESAEQKGRFTTLKDDVNNARPGQLERADIILTSLKQRLSGSPLLYRLAEMQDNLGAFYLRLGEPLDRIPLEYGILREAASALNEDLTKIFTLLNNNGEQQEEPEEPVL
jgi:HPt (histidine-containing phosphotransfer) domain-containing protein